MHFIVEIDNFFRIACDQLAAKASMACTGNRGAGSRCQKMAERICAVPMYVAMLQWGLTKCLSGDEIESLHRSF